MIAQYQFDRIFDNSDFSAAGLLTPGAIFEAFQKAAVDHAEATGCGFDDMLRQNLIWVVTKLRYEICGSIQPGEKCLVRTRPFEMKSLLVERDYFIFNSAGELAVKGAGIWCLLDCNTRKIARKPMKFSDEHITESVFETPFDRIKKYDGVYEGSYRIEHRDIDDNGHMNNCNYAKLAYHYSELSDVHAMTIYFEQEAFEGEKLSLAKGETDKGKVVYCCNDKGQAVFTALFK